MACTSDAIDPWCAYVAGRELNIPFSMYVFDDYRLQWLNPVYAKHVGIVGPDIMRNATNVIVPNEFLKKRYDREFGIRTRIVRNPVDLTGYRMIPSGTAKVAGSRICILYTGAIYEAQQDALNRLVRAIGKMQNVRITLRIYSENRWSPDPAYQDIVESHDAVPLCRMPEIQGKADILFLPLAFHSDFSDDLINTSSPGKIGEYLAAGRPVLVHAPENSFVSWYFKTHSCGEVVDSESEERLIGGLSRIIHDQDYRNLIAENAKNRALLDFNLEYVRTDFMSLFNPLRGTDKRQGQ
ncbi:MAG: hypothetical protein LUQ25_09325 [Methanoregulaceae archaeon]|nr:hypothetical protein [Methanoregulaceae archaeon]